MVRSELPLALMARLMRDAGAKRVGEDAKKALAEILDEVAQEASKKAASIAANAKRKTLRPEDIRAAVRDVMQK